MANKVEFGISNLYVGTYTEGAGGTVTLGTPLAIPGAVSFAPEESSEKSDFFADNGIYFSRYSGGSFEGDLEVALFPAEFKKQFLGYVELDNGGLATVKNAVKPQAYLMFQVEGDQESGRAIFYNVSFGAITREYNTIEESKEPNTETIPVTVVGDNKTGISKVTFVPSDAAYATLFTNPPVPALPE